MINLKETFKSFFRLIKNRKKLKPLIVFLATVILIPLLIVGVRSQQPVTVRVLIQALEATQLEPIVKDFNTEHPDINLEIVEAPNDTDQVEDLYTSAFLLGESPYDLVYMDIVWTPKFAAAGWLKDLSDRVSQEELDQFLEGDVNGGMLYYRTDWLEEAGYEPPETFSELIQISQALQDQNYTEWGYVWQGKQYEGLAAMFVEILEGFDAFWVDPDTLEVGLDQPDAIEAVNFLRNAIEEGVSPPGVTTYSEEPTRRLFQNGETAFLRNWPYVYGLASESDIAGDFAIKPMPHAPDGSSGACQGGWGMGIAKSTNHPEAAWEVVKYFSKAETQKKYALKTGYVPSRRELFNDAELVEKYSYLPELLNVIENAVLRPPIAQYSQASDILQRYLSAAIAGTMTPEEAMNAAARETRTLLKRSK